jgi:hypothetical protein
MTPFGIVSKSASLRLKGATLECAFQSRPEDGPGSANGSSTMSYSVKPAACAATKADQEPTTYPAPRETGLNPERPNVNPKARSTPLVVISRVFDIVRTGGNSDGGGVHIRAPCGRDFTR